MNNYLPRKELLFGLPRVPFVTCYQFMYLVIFLLVGFEVRIWDLIVSVPDHCLSFYFTFTVSYHIKSSLVRHIEDYLTNAQIWLHTFESLSPYTMALPIHFQIYISFMLQHF